MLAKANTRKIKVNSSNHTVYPILVILGICHLLNDTLQAVIPAMFPILEQSHGLTFTQLGFITFALNMVASVMQPVVGLYADKKPVPFALPIGLASSMIGMLGLALAPNFVFILLSVVFIGLGSAIFHPEGSRVAYLAAGSRRGLAQSIYQVGGNSGQALAPVITALVLVPLGQFGAIWFTLIAGLAVLFLIYIAKWYAAQVGPGAPTIKEAKPKKRDQQVSKAIKLALVTLVFIVFARSWYVSSLSSFYAFFAIDRYGLSIAEAQIYIFTFLGMGAVGTFLGGPIADQFGKKNVIVYSFLLATPLALLLPVVGPFVAIPLLGVLGLVITSSFSVSVVYAQELIPGKIGTMSGLIVGLGFGIGAIGSVALGVMIDMIGLGTTMSLMSLLPILGLLAWWLPSDQKVRAWYSG
ncbi:MFS transporter [Virgibacillus natechei]|uniref:MFS transporter n=1 Tax=Virgibacillus natechei TaxID=1216297 RepID=UPI003627359E